MPKQHYDLPKHSKTPFMISLAHIMPKFWFDIGKINSWIAPLIINILYFGCTNIIFANYSITINELTFDVFNYCGLVCYQNSYSYHQKSDKFHNDCISHFNLKLLFDQLILRNLVQNTKIIGMGVMCFNLSIPLFKTCFLITKLLF